MATMELHPRQHKLLKEISHEAGLRLPFGIYDFGVSYWLNGIRRWKTRDLFERAIIELSCKNSNRS